MEPGEHQVTELFSEYLTAQDGGTLTADFEARLLERAGPLGAALLDRIQAEKDLQALALERKREEDRSETPATIGHYRILGTIGTGGMGQVYLAQDLVLARRVALKVLERRGRLPNSERAWALNEGRSMASVEHPGVVRVHEVGKTDTCDYVAMEPLPGPSLAEVIAELARLRSGTQGAESPAPPVRPRVQSMAARLRPFSARTECLARIAEALAHCHDLGVLHRDLKPAHVLFDARGWPKLIDFGLAHLDRAEEDSKLDLTEKALVGTAAYLAPEQVEYDRTGADPRSDQFSFSVTAYELFALENPFRRETRTRTLDAIVLCRPPPLSQFEPAVSPDLARVIHHGLERDPAERYPDMAALAADLRAVLENRVPVVREPSLLHLAKLWFRRHRRAVAVSAAIVFLTSALWILAWSADHVRTRASIREALSAIDPSSFTRAADFEASFMPLFELQRRARDFDAGWLRGWLWGALSAQVEPVVASWSRRLGECYERELAESLETGLPFQELLYQNLFSKDAVLCPSCQDNREYRDRGKLILPWKELEGLEYELCQLGPMETREDVLSVFRPTEIVDYPVPGTYWFRAWKPGAERLAHEVVFFVEPGWPPAHEIRLVDRRAEFYERTVVLEPCRYPLLEGSELLVPAFRMLDHLVTIGEFERFLRDTHWVPGGFQTEFGGHACSPDEPAWVDLDSAMRFAAWAGGRLPSGVELWVARRSGSLEFQGQGHVSAEYVLDLYVPADRSRTRKRGALDPARWSYGPWQEGARNCSLLDLVPGRHEVLVQVDRVSGVSTTVGFRVVYADDRPDNYSEFVRYPTAQ